MNVFIDSTGTMYFGDDVDPVHDEAAYARAREWLRANASFQRYVLKRPPRCEDVPWR